MMWAHMWSHGQPVTVTMNPAGVGLGWGLDGLWWAMTLTVYLEAALSYLRFRSGAWARVRLEQPQRRSSDHIAPPIAPRLPAAGDLAEEPLEQVTADMLELPEGEAPPLHERRHFSHNPAGPPSESD